MEERGNIWMASSDGDLARVKQLIEKEGIDVNAQDVRSPTIEINILHI